MWWMTTTLGRSSPSTGCARYASISSPLWPVIVVDSAMIASDIAGRSDALQDRARAQTATAAHRDERVGAVDALELVQRLGDEHRAGRSERVAQRDRAPVRVHGFVVGVELALPRQHDGCEGLVDLSEVHVVHRHAGALEQAVRRVDRAGEHQNRVTADETGVDDAGPRLQPER